jgi:hypothetical protein
VSESLDPSSETAVQVPPDLIPQLRSLAEKLGVEKLETVVGAAVAALTDLLNSEENGVLILCVEGRGVRWVRPTRDGLHALHFEGIGIKVYPYRIREGGEV